MKRDIVVATAALLLISACGGDGGGTAPIVSSEPTLQITSNNATLVSKVAYETALSSSQSSDLGGGFFIGSASGNNSKLISGAALQTKASNSGSGSQIPIPAETIPCAVSGTSTISGDIADIVTPTLSAGDFFEIDFDNCDDGLGEVTDGRVRTDIDAFSGDLLSELFNLTMSLTLTNLQVSIFENQSTVPSDVVTSNGGMTVALDNTSFPFVSTNVSGNSLVVDTNASSESLTNFRSEHTLDGNSFPSPYTSSSSGTIDSSQLSGIVRYSNPVEFAGFGPDFPDTGEFLVEGLNSSLRLVAEDNINVSIEIDVNADGTVDETINTTWAALTAQ